MKKNLLGITLVVLFLSASSAFADQLFLRGAFAAPSSPTNASFNFLGNVTKSSSTLKGVLSVSLYNSYGCTIRSFQSFSNLPSSDGSQARVSGTGTCAEYIKPTVLSPDGFPVTLSLTVNTDIQGLFVSGHFEIVDKEDNTSTTSDFVTIQPIVRLQ